MYKVLLMIVILFNAGCASYQSGKFASFIKGNHPPHTPITVEVDELLSDNNYTVINFNFGNKSDQWLRVKSVRLNYKNVTEDKKINVVVGKDISTWYDAIKHKIAVDQWNESVAIGTLAVIGGVTSGIGAYKGNNSLTNLGAATYVGAVGISGFNTYADGLDDVNRAKILPKSHLYTPFSVPLGLYAKKWILLQVKRKHMPRKLYFDVVYISGEKVEYAAQINLGRAKGLRSL
jgi:hypothetical protein